MSVITTVKATTESQFPALRVLKYDIQHNTTDKYGPLVVLFTSRDEGVALSGVAPSRIGVPEEWEPFDDDGWSHGSITLSSID